jgi:hypothetical protein
VFAWHHLFTLYRYRRDILPLDSELLLTQGSPVNLLGSLSPARGIMMGYCPSDNGDPSLIGQMRYAAGDRSAHISYLAPGSAVDSPGLPSLLDYFARQAGRQGAYHLLAEPEEHHPVFESLRRSGFSVYAWQRIWEFQVPGPGRPNDLEMWRQARSIDEIAVRTLFQSLVPPLIQAAEPLSDRLSRSLVYQQGDETMAYVEGVYGPRGIFLCPIIHPDVGNPTRLLADLLQHLPLRLGRPVYVSVRSYQSWLETSLQQLDGQFGPRQALMVKHMVTAQRVEAFSARRAVLENPQAEPTASITPSIYNSKN